MAQFLLIHGSCHGAWCWEAVLPRLAELGHAARAIDLPGHGADTTPLAEITLDGYARAIAAALAEMADGPVVLVGHSMAGYPVTAAAALMPQRIARLVYLCAYVPRPGLGLAEMRRLAPRQPLAPAIRVSEDRVSFRIDPELATEVFYHDVPAPTAARAIARLGAQAVLPQETPLLALPPDDLPRSYILCEHDRTIPPEFQHEMTRDWPAADVHRRPGSHSPFLAQPAALARLLDAIATG